MQARNLFTPQVRRKRIDIGVQKPNVEMQKIKDTLQNID